MKTKKISTIPGIALSFGLLIAMLPLRAAALTTVQNDKFSMDVTGRLQWLGVVEDVPDPFAQDDRMYLFMKQARLRWTGMYGDVKYDVQTAYGGEDIPASSNATLGLLDYSFDVPLPLNAW